VGEENHSIRKINKLRKALDKIGEMTPPFDVKETSCKLEENERIEKMEFKRGLDWMNNPINKLKLVRILNFLINIFIFL